MHLACRIIDDPASDLLMRHPAHALKDVTERAMSQIMKKRCRQTRGLFLLADRAALAKLLEHEPGRLHHAQAVAVARMVSPWIGQARHPKLTDAPQPLHFLRIDQTKQQ